MKKPSYLALAACICLVFIPAFASAKTIKKTKVSTAAQKHAAMEAIKLSAVGKVSSIDGSTINLAGDNGKDYVIDAAKAKIYKGSTIISLADIKADDALTVFGPLTDYNISATKIINNTGKAPTKTKIKTAVKKPIAKIVKPKKTKK